MRANDYQIRELQFKFCCARTDFYRKDAKSAKE